MAEPPSSPAAPNAAAPEPTLRVRLAAILQSVGMWIARRFAKAEWEVVATAANANAWRARRPQTTIDDIAIVCLHDAHVVDSIRRVDGDPLAIAARLDAALSARPPSEELEGKKTIKNRTTTAWERVLMAIHPHRGLRDLKDAKLTLLFACFREPVSLAAAAFEAEGLSPRRFALAAVHGLSQEPTASTDSDQVAVVVINDDFTPEDIVCSIFQSVLAVPHEISHPLMESIGRLGRSTVFEGTKTEAARICAALNLAAAERRIPMLALTEPRSPERSKGSGPGQH